MVAFNIDAIVAHISKNWFAKPYLYTVQVGGSSHVPDMPLDVMFNCAMVTIPGINIGFVPDKRHGIGIITNYPNQKAFTELNLTFYESEFENEKKYFSTWIDSIYNKNTGRMGFYKNYIKEIIINQFNRKNQMTYQVKLSQCYPTNIATLDRGYAMENTISQFSVSLQFYDMQEVFYNPADGTLPMIQMSHPAKDPIIWDK